jgi:outer membrane protein TolC
MTWVLAVAFLLAFGPAAAGQAPARAPIQAPALTLDLALDEASSSHPEIVVLRRHRESAEAADTEASNHQFLERGSEVLAEARRAYVELMNARSGLALYEAQAPVLLEMAHAGTGPDRADGMAGHDGSRASVFARVAAALATWRERARLAEIRLNAALGRDLGAVVPTLFAREFSEVPPDAERMALERDPQMAAADAEVARATSNTPQVELARARREVVVVRVRRRVLEALVRVNAARERLLIASTTLLPQMQLAYDSARLSYSSGRGVFGEMVDSYHRLLEARMDHANASAEYDAARVNLEIAMGETPERLAKTLAGAQGN